MTTPLATPHGADRERHRQEADYIAHAAHLRGLVARDGIAWLTKRITQALVDADERALVGYRLHLAAHDITHCAAETCDGYVQVPREERQAVECDGRWYCSLACSPLCPECGHAYCDSAGCRRLIAAGEVANAS